PRIINQKIAQKLIEKISMTDIAHQLFISTSTVIRKLNDFHFKHPQLFTPNLKTIQNPCLSLDPGWFLF
ncbi:hypothetical protein OLE66_10930, partial [Streptococcus pneumoniae]|nr:hypothetical protein [Streptococcus pneumoniae]